MLEQPPAMAGWNLALRFGLELAALAGLATGAWRLSGGPGRFVAVVAVPIAAVTIWGVFNVPDDPSRSGAAPVAVPGSLRLAIELVVLGVGAAGFATGGLPWPGLVLAALVVVHYVTSRPRVRWLLTAAG